MKKYCANKDIQKLVLEMIGKSWSFKNKRKHGVLIAPTGQRVIIPSSPSDFRAYINLRSNLRSLSRFQES